MVDYLRESRSWDKALEGGLPDCRLRAEDRERTTFWRGRALWETVYCANCHKPNGAVSANWTPHVFYICDECFAKAGTPPGTIQVKQ